MDGDDDNEEDPFGFPIQENNVNVHMKNIPQFVLPNFKGMISEDPKTFLFEFEIICRSYGYSLHIQKLNLFSATFKDRAIKWFMNLGRNAIRTWDDMKRVLLEKYKFYCIHHVLRNQIFKMNQEEDESLEDLVERFTYNIKIFKLHNLGSDTLKTLLLNVTRDEWIDLFNLVGKGDVYQLSFQEIFELSKNISRGKAKYGRFPQDPVTTRLSKSTS